MVGIVGIAVVDCRRDPKLHGSLMFKNFLMDGLVLRCMGASSY